MSLEEQQKETVNSNVTISEEVISTIVGIAATGVKGVAEMSAGLTGGIYDLIGKKNPAKGVRIELDGNNVKIDLYLTVEYGVKIPEIALAVQEAVKSSVETMTGLNPIQINVHVQGLTTGGEAPKETKPGVDVKEAVKKTAKKSVAKIKKNEKATEQPEETSKD